MKKIVLGTLLATAITASATLHAAGAAEAKPTQLELKDGTMLYLDSDGTSRMVDAQGKPMSMKDGKKMEMMDGRVLMMKNKNVWLMIGPPGKGVSILKKDCN